MSDCQNLVHPFQTDPGVNQPQRVLDDLLSGSAKIDGRTMADLLNYFVELSRHVNYYDTQLRVSDWQPFFQKSIPFTLAGIINYNKKKTRRKFDSYNKLFDKKPSKQRLQLILQYVFNNTLQRINTWQVHVQQTGLPVEPILVRLMRDKLLTHLRDFIGYANSIATRYKLKKIDFTALSDNPVWNLEIDQLYVYKEPTLPGPVTPRKRLIAYRDEIIKVFPLFLDLVDVAALSATNSMEQSFIPLKEELQKNHAPHLGLLFAFLKLFQQLQQELNGYTKKHLDFFYREVLKLLPRAASPDKAHIVFDIQKQLDKYLLKKGLLLKDGKDANKAEVFFALNDEIVVNKAQVADVRTLFLNNQLFNGYTYAEGVYIAPDARKADGVKIDFKEPLPPNWYTLGSKLSKYTDPETKLLRPHPNARIGFLLASPVLLLEEGKRTIDITLACELNNDYCLQLQEVADPNKKNCCEGGDTTDTAGVPPRTNREECDKDNTAVPVPACVLFDNIQQELSKKYYYVSEPLIQEAIKKGFGKDIIRTLREILKKANKKLCYCEVDQSNFETIIEASLFEQIFVFDMDTVSTIFKPEGVFKIAFSGEKEWVDPSTITNISFEGDLPDCSADGPYGFSIKFNVVLEADKPAITYFNKDNLKEDYGTLLPVVKIELNDHIKLIYTDEELKKELGLPDSKDNCCLLKEGATKDAHIVSLYHFFRNVIVQNRGANQTMIDVRVCGLRNVIVQNDENLLDVNNPMEVFGVRPKVGSSFYIGSKEIFSKNWKDIWINAEWKDLPPDLKEHYKFYYGKDENFEDGTDEITNLSFRIKGAVLENRNWLLDKFVAPPPKPGTLKFLFPDVSEPRAPLCDHPAPVADVDNVYHFARTDFPGSAYKPLKPNPAPLDPLNIKSDYGFLRLMLKGVSFQHDRYAFVLARHMMAVAGQPDPIAMIKVLENLDRTDVLAKAIQNRINGIIARVTLIKTKILDILDKLSRDDIPVGVPNVATDGVRTLLDGAIGLLDRLTDARNALPGNPGNAITHLDAAIPLANAISARIGNLAINNSIIDNSDEINDLIDEIKDLATKDADGDPNNVEADKDGIEQLIADQIKAIDIIKQLLKADQDLKVGLPKEPYTPSVKTLFLDYTATADIKDMDLIHLHPYAGTYKPEDIEQQPTLFPTFCHEGNLMIGLQDLVPGSNLNILFQLAEATADSETAREIVQWYYLANNQWKQLRKGFEVLEDGTDGLTTSGVIKLALPENMTSDNTILPAGLHWIRASIPLKSQSVSETIGIHTQAVQVTFTNDAANDKQRLATPLPAGSIAKLKDADASVKKVSQLYPSFGGQVPEEQGQYYVRVSELLRHKNRAIQKWDYEHMVLEAFPQLYRVKCINHTYGLDAHIYNRDFTVAPGYVLLGVIPDLQKLQAGLSAEPRVPVSLLEQITDFLRKRISPFVRLKVMNPRYEKVNICLKVKLYLGKDENYYREKLAQDLREFIAPWLLGNQDELRFAQCLSISDMVRFVESRDYVDYIMDIQMGHEYDNNGKPEGAGEGLCPKTPRSILIAGDIDICIQQQDCEQWDTCTNPNGQQIPCCENDAIPVKDYCKPITPPNGPIIT